MARRRLALVGAIALVAGVLMTMPPAMAATINVVCPGDDLQTAIDGADPGDTIEVAAGTCTGGIMIDKNLELHGAGAGVTFIDAAGSGSAILVSGDTVSLSGLTVTGGDTFAGGGIRASGTELTLSNVIVTRNAADLGAGIWTDAGTTTNLRSVIVRSNTAVTGSGAGGGIRTFGAISAINVTVSHNQALTAGGIWIGTDGSVDGDKVEIVSNTATTGFGGGVAAFGELTLRSSEIRDNRAPAGTGGGVHSTGATPSVSLTDTTVADNTSDGDGAGIHASSGSVTVDRSTISGNEVTDGGGVGGGLYVEGTATLDVTNSTVSGNTAPNAGGGLATASGTIATFVHSTITGNTASTWGGGGVAVGSGPGVRVTASILAGNTASSGPDCKPSVTSTGNNIVGDTSNCTVAPAIIPDQLDTDPKLGPLRDNGGLTMSHAPAPDSPALAVFAAPCGGGVVVDQRDLPRPVHPSDRCDIGAIENYPPRPEGDAYTVQAGGTLTIAAPGVLENDTDREGHSITWSHSHPDEPSHGTLAKQTNGAFTYVHDGSDTTTDSFRYYVTDGTPTFTSGTVTITITPIPRVEATVGLVDPTQGRWHLRNSTGAVTSFYFGNPGDYPMMGDWDCDGVETPGLYRQSDGFVYLRNSNSVGVADIRFFFGNPGDIPLAGDFDGDGCDTVSIYRPDQGQVFIINELGENEGGLGAAEFSYYFGNPGDKPFVGDFTDDGIETVGLHRESTGLVYFRNSHTAGVADAQFIFGDPGDRLVCGDWNRNGVGSPGLFRPSDTTFYLRYSNTQGVADDEFVWGEASWLPVAGAFGLG